MAMAFIYRFWNFYQHYDEDESSDESDDDERVQTTTPDSKVGKISRKVQNKH